MSISSEYKISTISLFRNQLKLFNMMYPSPRDPHESESETEFEHTMPSIEITNECDACDGDTDSTDSAESVETGDGSFDPVSVRREPSMTLYSDPMVKEAAARKRRTEEEARKAIEKQKSEQQPTTINDVVSALQDKYEQMVRQYKYDVAHDSEAARYGYRFGPGPYSNNTMRKYGSYNNGDAQPSHPDQQNRRLLQVIWMGLTMTLMMMMIMSANANAPVLRVKGTLAPELINATMAPRDGDMGETTPALASLHQKVPSTLVEEEAPGPPPPAEDDNDDDDNDDGGDDDDDDIAVAEHVEDSKVSPPADEDKDKQEEDVEDDHHDDKVKEVKTVSPPHHHKPKHHEHKNHKKAGKEVKTVSPSHHHKHKHHVHNHHKKAAGEVENVQQDQDQVSEEETSEHSTGNDSANTLKITLKTHGYNLISYYFKKPIVDLDFNGEMTQMDNFYIWNKMAYFKNFIS